MAARPVASGERPPAWKLAAPHDACTQGLLVSGFAALPTGRALFLELSGPDGAPTSQGWLADLESVAPISDADGRDDQAAAIGFTWSGLRRMGLDEQTLASFSRPFREGMFQEDRARRLGDRRGKRWLETVVEGGPSWSGNPGPRAPAGVDDPSLDGDTVETPITVHVLLLLYEASEAAADARTAEVEKVLARHAVRIVHRLPLVLDPDHQGISREHFGFADGLSQPAPYDQTAVTVAGAPASSDGPNAVPLGEFLIGHLNGHHEKAPGPITPSGSAADAHLPAHELAEGFRDLGVDGSYMVVRQLRQDVAAFWRSMDAGARKIAANDPQNAAQVNAQWLAERVIGRNADGHLLCPGGVLAADRHGLPDNEFLFLPRDREGVGCPAGSHVRRANPRDSLAPKPELAQTLLDAANNHRILRRGRKYGPKLADPSVDDGVARGLLFICLNTDIARQFEFVQQTWLLNENFATLFDERDPLVGPKGKMTIRDTPLRRVVDVETFVQLVGGEYFFLPSLPALRYLASLA
jgi:deferrochelatase/peroxidase EfeB